MKISCYLAGDPIIVLVKFHENRLRIKCEIDKKLALQVNVTSTIDVFMR